jgi:hypothetical protein
MKRLQCYVVMGFGLAAVLLTAGCSKNEEETSATQEAAPPSTQQDVAPPSAQQDAARLPSTQFTVQSEGSGFDPARAYDEQCPDDEDEPSLECEWLRGLVVADVVEALEAIEESRDQRGVEEAVAALDIDDEPEVLIAACRVLGRFPDTPGLADKLTPLMLDSPWLEVQRMAAAVLRANPEMGLAAMADQWTSNHQSLLSSDDPYDELPALPAHYAAMGFPEYPGAEWFTPADSDRSVGWWTADAPSEVVAKLSDTLGVEALDYQQWLERSQQQMMNAMQSIDEGKLEELQQLVEEFVKTQDPELMQRIETLQAEIAAPMEQVGDATDMDVTQVATPPGSADPDQIHYLIAEEKEGHVARVILVYRQKVPERTVMQMSWDLRDYPRAWAVE